MTEETSEDELASPDVPPEKLLIDDPSSFQFHAAYIAYSDAYDNVADSEIKKQLNESIAALKQDEIDYSTFYGRIGKYREGGSHHLDKTRIKTQKKREWRRKAQKRERNKRHRK
jgi:hypothetical protein